MLAKLKTWPLRSCVFELLSLMQPPDMHFFRSRRSGGWFLSYFSCHSSKTLCVLNTVTSKFDLCCRPLSAQRVCMANTLTPLLISCQKFVWSCGRSTFDDYRCTIPGTNFISYQQYCIIPGTKGKWTFHLIRHTYVSGTCMYAMNTSHTWRPVLGFSIYALEVFWIFCCRTPR